MGLLSVWWTDQSETCLTFYHQDSFNGGAICQFQFHNLDATIALKRKTKVQIIRPDTALQKAFDFFVLCLNSTKDTFDTLNSVKAGKKAIKTLQK